MLNTSKTTLVVRNLDRPDKQQTSPHGVMDVVNLPGMTMVRATFGPGWKWSTDVAQLAGTESCQVAHAGVVLSGRFHVRMDDGRDYDLGPGDAHVVAPGHDAWVVGDEPVVVLDVALTSSAMSGHSGRCPCGVEFRVATGNQVEHLVAAIREHAATAHGHELTPEQIRADLSAA